MFVVTKSKESIKQTGLPVEAKIHEILPSSRTSKILVVSYFDATNTKILCRRTLHNFEETKYA
jgi:transcriptional regulator of met regulon